MGIILILANLFHHSDINSQAVGLKTLVFSQNKF
jgi:hypothetical protein